MGTTEVARDSLKIEVNKPASWSAQDLRIRPVIPSGPAAFLTRTVFSSLRTSSSDTVITWSSLLCLLFPDSLIGRVTLAPLHSKQPWKLFNLSVLNNRFCVWIIISYFLSVVFEQDRDALWWHMKQMANIVSFVSLHHFQHVWCACKSQEDFTDSNVSCRVTSKPKHFLISDIFVIGLLHILLYFLYCHNL